MAIGTVFENNRTQAVRLPADTRFPVGVKRVVVRVVGRERVLCPVENSWDSFFFGEKTASDDFMDERNQPKLPQREPL